ncbi:MAG: NAD-dependent epimerase/dehydratase family protein [Chloroflexia bacterium]
MTVLITGGTGFIGANVARLLLARGEGRWWSSTTTPQRLDEIAEKVELSRGIWEFRPYCCTRWSGPLEVIFHLGGMLSFPSEADPAAALQANAMGTYHVLEAARLFKVPKVIFSSTIATFGMDITEPVLTDDTIQRPELFYGITKVFGEQLGFYYRRKYDLDFRGVRFPSIVGPGVRTPAIVQYNSWVIEECAKGNPYEIYVDPETRCPVMYFKDAARSLVRLADAPREAIKRGVYVIAGVTPIVTAGELADLVRAQIPGAQITFNPDRELQPILDRLLLPPDDRNAQQEWGWEAAYSQADVIDDFLRELRDHPQRYE